MDQRVEEDSVTVPEGVSAELFQDVCQEFREGGSWPRYRDFEIRYRKKGPLEVALRPLFPELVQVYGSHDDRDLRLSDLSAYQLCEGTDVDVDRFVRSACFFAQRYIASNGRDDAQVRGLDLQDHFDLNEAETLRLCHLIDSFGRILQNGSGRGQGVSGWYFGVSPRAMYFEDVETVEQFREKEELVRSLQDMEGRRSSYGWRSTPQPEPMILADPSPSTAPSDFPQAQWRLHPAVAHAAAGLFGSGHYSEAVRRAMQRFESYLQDSLQDFGTTGWRLVSSALNPKTPKIRLNAGLTAQDQDEQEGFFHLAAGAMQAFRNVHSHGKAVDLTEEEAIEELAVVSCLFRRLDGVAREMNTSDRDTDQGADG